MNRSRFAAVIAMLLISLPAIAQQQAATEKTSAAFPKWAFDPALYIITALCLILMITIYVLYKVNMTLLNVISPKPVADVKSETRTPVQKKDSFLRKVYIKMVDSVPVEKEKDVLLDHDYDGIKELDNNLPPWWKYGFYFTIAFAAVYLLYYHVSGVGKLQEAEYAEEVQVAAQEKAARLLASADNVNEESVVQLTDPDGISKGKETFTKLCAACHRADAGGQVGPNLTDEYWLHGGGIKNVFKTITYGVPTKGMISWQTQLSPKQIQQVASYVLSLKGSNPAGGKDPQGDIWKDESNAKPDSTATSDSTSNKKVAALTVEGK
jgi:cytochrome c oxidase cbb3-type subunit 3